MPNAHAGWARELRSRPRKRKLWFLLHGATLLCLLGLPYLRGRLRASDKLRDYTDTVACVYGGAAREDAGVESPTDGPPHFAARFVHPPPGWPGACEAPLERLHQDPAWVLLPAVKNAESDVQRAARLLLRELRAMSAPGSLAQPVPVRPLLAMRLLGDAIEAHSAAADVPVPARSGVAFSATDARFPNPSLVAINASESAASEVWHDSQGLHMVAVDGTGASYLGVHDTYPKRARLRSRHGLRYVVSDGARSHLVWSTAPERCAAPGSCATRSLGLARVDTPLTQLPEPRWIAAHPLTRPDRSLAWRGDRLWIAAARRDGLGGLRALPVETALGVAKGEEQGPVEVETLGLQGAEDIALVASSEAGDLGYALVRSTDATRVDVVLLGPAGQRGPVLASLPGKKAAGWVVACEGQGPSAVSGFVAGNDAELVVGHVGEHGSRSWRFDMAVSDAASPATRRRNRVRAVCHPGGTSAVVLRGDGTLFSLRCARASPRCEPEEQGSDVEAFDVLEVPGGVLVAYAGASPDAAQIRLRTLRHAGAQGEPTVAAPCWREHRGGMCGAPLLARVRVRVLLGARNGFDMLALESKDEGRTWTDLGPWFMPAPAADRAFGFAPM